MQIWQLLLMTPINIQYCVKALMTSNTVVCQTIHDVLYFKLSNENKFLVPHLKCSLYLPLENKMYRELALKL